MKKCNCSIPQHKHQNDICEQVITDSEVKCGDCLEKEAADQFFDTNPSTNLPTQPQSNPHPNVTITEPVSSRG
ncbi:MAG: hypothetical protein G01um10147_949 [Microgenomates group bacterium Gr01-1014_7]|nr:MAG: hypothetical protein G01um10147_949 [Microgenomates group bacterium Gr01-1014_7]